MFFRRVNLLRSHLKLNFLVYKHRLRKPRCVSTQISFHGAQPAAPTAPPVFSSSLGRTTSLGISPHTVSPVRGGPVLTRCGRHFHTSSPVGALPGILVGVVLKPLQKLMAVILGRSIRKWWKALPANRQQLMREWAWQHRWHLATWAGMAMMIVLLFLLTHLDETPVTGRTRLLVFSKERFMELAALISDAYMEELAELLVPATDPRHQVVERVVQHLTQRNKDIPEMPDLAWSVHVVDSPDINAFVLPNGAVFMFTGMLEAVADVHQLTIVLGHEMAHVILGHAAEQASLSHVVDLLSLILLTAIWAMCPQDSLALLGQWVQNKLSQLIFSRPYSRKLEAEADRVGLQMAAKACADVRAGPVFWQQMEIRDQMHGRLVVPEWLSTHPSHKNRSNQLNRLVPQALELRESCICPALPATDPRSVFAKNVRVLLETPMTHGTDGQKETQRPHSPHSSESLHAGLPAALFAQTLLPPSMNVGQESKGVDPPTGPESAVAASIPAPVEEGGTQRGGAELTWCHTSSAAKIPV